MNNLQWFIIFCCNIHISDPPTCRTRTQVLYTVAINTSVELECSMVANPQHDIIFRHQCIFLIYQQFKFWKRFWNLYKKNRSLCFFSNPFPQYFRNPTMSYYRVSPQKRTTRFLRHPIEKRNIQGCVQVEWKHDSDDQEDRPSDQQQDSLLSNPGHPLWFTVLSRWHCHRVRSSLCLHHPAPGSGELWSTSFSLSSSKHHSYFIPGEKVVPVLSDFCHL